MTTFNRMMRFSVICLLTACLAPTALRANSYSYSPDTVTFTPSGQDSITGYVRIAYTGDSSGPGTYIHAWISDGSSYFSVSADTIHVTTHSYIRIVYHVQSGTVTGQLSISDDTTTHTVVLIGHPNPPPPAITAEGPYFPNISEGSDTCTTMRLINPSSNPDTIHTVSWSHNSNGIFTWDSVSLPYILSAGDTTFWTFCFHAPNNTTENIDTLRVYYGSGDAYVSRLVEAAGTSSLSAVGPYFPSGVREGGDTCTTMRLVNTGSSADTIESVTWAHNSNGIFVWDTTALPITLGAHDTTYLTFCWHAPYNAETYYDTVSIAYHSSAGSGYATRIVGAAAQAPPPDGALRAIGPYFPGNIPEGGDTCVSQGSIWPLVLINAGSDVDTIESISWTHDPGSIFSWDSSGTSFPFTMPAGDTMYWTACFHAPSDTDVHWDTLIIRYHDANSNDRSVNRIVYAKAVDTTIKTCYGMYAAQAPITNYGDTSYIHLYIHNYLTSSSSLTAIHISGTDDGAFRVDSSGFPNTIATNAYDSVWLKFIPNRTSGSTEYNATASLTFSTTDTTHCHEAAISLVGYMPQTCSDTESVSLDTTGTHDVSLSGDSGRYYAHRIDFTNSSSSTIRVSAVGWTHSSSHFLVSQIVPPLPDTLAPGKGMAIIIHFYGDSSGTIYLDTLALTVQAGIAERSGRFTPQSGGPGIFYVNFKGISNTVSSVAAQTVPNAPNLLLYPNPSSGIVNMELDGATNVTFEVIDVLGNVIATHTGTGTWQWNANAVGLPSNGTYFIRASNGNEVTTKRLVLQR
ncbi:MAG: T9SS type A sorting domain-containing protein [Candidatus Kapaibacterium sp.]